MSKKSDTNQRRAPLYVVLILITLFAFIFLVRILKENQNFDNARINGEYTGNVIIISQNSMQMNITFDGFGNIEGTIIIDDEELHFSNSSYICISDSVQFSIYFIDIEKRVTFNGVINSDNLLITGDIQYYSDFQTLHNGTLTLTKVLA